MKQTETITILKPEIRHIESSLKWGSRKELANILGISPSMLRYHLTPKKKYSVTEKKPITVLVLKMDMYETIIRFINTLD